jgi:hypothetical protein
MPTVLPPDRTEISDTYPNPSNAEARVGFGKLWDYVTNLLGLAGSPAAARTALEVPAAADVVLLTGAQSIAGVKTFTDMPVLPVGQLTASLGANVALNNTANYFDGPAIAQGVTGRWWVAGNIVVQDTNNGGGNISVKLWDGTTVIDSAYIVLGVGGGVAGNTSQSAHLSGFINAPAGNLRISARNATNTANTNILFNGSGNSKDSTISAFRIS